MRHRDEEEPRRFEAVRHCDGLGPVRDGEPHGTAVRAAYHHLALGIAVVWRDPDSVAHSDDEGVCRVVPGKHIQRTPHHGEGIRKFPVAHRDYRGAVRRKRYVGVEAVAYRLDGGIDRVRPGVLDFNFENVAPEVAPFHAERGDKAFKRKCVEAGGLRGAVVLPVRDAVAVGVRPAERHEAQGVDGNKRIDLPIAPDKPEVMFACGDLGEEEKGVGISAVRSRDRLARDEETVHVEREIEERRFGIEVVLANADRQRVRAALRDGKPPTERTGALGGEGRAIGVRLPCPRG